MNENIITETISKARKDIGMTQEKFASCIGVTPQAISRWERGLGLPDTSILGGICEILKIDANTLLGIKNNSVVENNDYIMDKEIKNNAIAEPLLLDFGQDIIPCFIEGLKTSYINECRKKLASETGILMPLLRIKDNLDLKDNEFQILSYDKILIKRQIHSIDKNTFKNIIDEVVCQCKLHFPEIINKQLVKIMIDNLEMQYPGITEGVIPEKISYLQIKKIIKDEYKKNGTIRNLISILEVAEENL